MTVEWRDMSTCPKTPDEPVLLRVSGRPVLASWFPADNGIYDVGVWDNWLNGDPYGLPISGEPDAWCPVPK